MERKEGIRTVINPFDTGASAGFPSSAYALVGLAKLGEGPPNAVRSGLDWPV